MNYQSNHGIEQQPAPSHAGPQEKSASYTQKQAPIDQPPPAYSSYNAAKDPYPSQQPMTSTAPPVTPLNLLRDSEAWIDCPFCQRRTRTRIDKVDSGMTYVLGLLLCLICICAACIPCIAHWCADIDHYCGDCGQRVASMKYNSGVTHVLAGPDLNAVPSRYAAGPGVEANRV
ncbi:LPS-induced tumor necrosis factor alpha factor [Teratosphaeria destructans]|uniref:LPS-induced tumor necrosis factor alpha factor n=1 Tax=Teratosphaeria destructans TaxID=418781 RepID=A0A9W7SWN6_9PEZI|nr:LPS-induced tumor necrosis factor alpha factor [Teratosphaeria destructans]